MFEFQDKKKIRRIIYSRFFMLILFVISVGIGWASLKMYERLVEVEKRLNLALNEESALKEKEAELTTRISDLSTERGIEEEIRKKFRVVREGESVIIILDKNSAETNTSTTTPNFYRIIGDFWSKLFPNFFRGN